MTGADRLLRVGVLLCLLASSAAGQDVTLVPSGALWKYRDDGSNQGTAWRLRGFDDSSWGEGPAELGYGDGRERTVVSYGPDPRNKHITTWFRHSFSVAQPDVFARLTLRILRDDGAVVYLNGTEVFRTNMPAGTVTWLTRASTAVTGAAEREFQAVTFAPSFLTAGTNVLAVEIHQVTPTSPDISFDLELTATVGIGVTRGPYLQAGHPTGLTVCWRTSAPTDSRVRYGPAPGNLDLVADDPIFTTEHVVGLRGLAPGTRYFYSVGTTAGPLAGGDADHVFVTPPPPQSARPARVWVLGDSGTADAGAAAVRDAYYAFAGNSAPDLWLMLGDNAYYYGTDAEYQRAVFDMYPAMLRRSVLWPTRGNHEWDALGSGSTYYSIFTLPSAGEAGGVPSGTEAYYAFDHGNVHFICLDSYGSDRAPHGAMARWLETDLQATTAEWIVAFWHHPPYSKGSHDSDRELELIEMRKYIVPILEEGGVDLVLAGHSHSYERSFLIDGHDGPSWTLHPSMIKDAGSGREEETGAYRKPPGTPAHEGAVYAVAGSSGQISGGALNHPAMFLSLNRLGSMVLDFEGNRLDVKFLRETGAVDDWFTLQKMRPDNRPPDVALVRPPDGADFLAPATIPIEATASDPDGAVTRVELFQGSTRLAALSAPPWRFDWCGVPPGAYSLRARAVDDLGLARYSTPVDVTVRMPRVAAFQDGVAPTAAYGGTRDATIAEWSPAARLGRRRTLHADGDHPPGSGRDASVLLRWDLSTIPPGSRVAAATLTFEVRNGTAQLYPIHALLRPWVETGTSWRDAARGAAWQLPGARGAADRGTAVLGSLGPAAPGSVTVLLAPAGVAQVQSWVDEPAGNFGIVLSDATNADGIVLASRESATPAARPRLTVLYGAP